MSSTPSQRPRSVHVRHIRFTLCACALRNPTQPTGCLTNLWTANGDLLQYKNTKLVDVLEVIQEEHETGVLSPAVAAVAAGGATNPDQLNPMLGIDMAGANAPEGEGGVEMAATAVSRGTNVNGGLRSEIEQAAAQTV